MRHHLQRGIAEATKIGSLRAGPPIVRHDRKQGASDVAKRSVGCREVVNREHRRLPVSIAHGHDVRRRPDTNCTPKSGDRLNAGGMMLVGMNIEAERFALYRLKLGGKPERELRRTVTANEEMGASFRFKPVCSPPARGRETQRAEGARPSDRSYECHRLGAQLGRPAQQGPIGGRHVGWHRERSGPEGPTSLPADAGARR